MANSNNITLSIPLIGNIILIVASGASAQISLGTLPTIALCVALVLGATALSQ